MPDKHVVVDGSNIATEGRNRPSLSQLDEAVQAFLREYPHDKCTVVVDATFGHRIDKSESKAFEDALEAGEVITPPAGAIGRGDAFVLEIADKVGANVFSNDSFQEFHGTYEWLFDEGRLIGGKPVPDVGWVFLFRAPVRGPASRKARRQTKKTDDRGRGRSRKDSSGGKPKPEQKASTTPPERASGRGGDKGGRDRARSTKKVEPINEPLVFLEFVADHPVGTAVKGDVKEFSSHGAYVDVAGARCYVPLKLMSDPPPRSPKDRLELEATEWFVVEEFDAPRRSIDLALPGMQSRPLDELPKPVREAASDEPAAAEGSEAADQSEARVRVHQVAKRLGVASKDVVDATTHLGFPVKGHQSSLTSAQVEQIETHFADAAASSEQVDEQKSAAKKAASGKKASGKKAATKKAATKKKPATKKATKKKAAAKKKPATKSATKKKAAKKKKATQKKATPKGSAAKK